MARLEIEYSTDQHIGRTDFYRNLHKKSSLAIAHQRWADSEDPDKSVQWAPLGFRPRTRGYVWRSAVQMLGLPDKDVRDRLGLGDKDDKCNKDLVSVGLGKSWSPRPTDLVSRVSSF
jgi:hypothetical protein